MAGEVALLRILLILVPIFVVGALIIIYVLGYFGKLKQIMGSGNTSTTTQQGIPPGPPMQPQTQETKETDDDKLSKIG